MRTGVCVCVCVRLSTCLCVSVSPCLCACIHACLVPFHCLCDTIMTVLLTNHWDYLCYGSGHKVADLAWVMVAMAKLKDALVR